MVDVSQFLRLSVTKLMDVALSLLPLLNSLVLSELHAEIVSLTVNVNFALVQTVFVNTRLTHVTRPHKLEAFTQFVIPLNVTLELPISSNLLKISLDWPTFYRTTLPSLQITIYQLVLLLQIWRLLCGVLVFSISRSQSLPPQR
jgi:hypothetical protein